MTTENIEQLALCTLQYTGFQTW